MTSKFNILSHEFMFKFFNGFALGKLWMYNFAFKRSVNKVTNTIQFFLQILKLVLKLEMNSQTYAWRPPLGPKNSGRCLQVVVIQRSFK